MEEIKFQPNAIIASRQERQLQKKQERDERTPFNNINSIQQRVTFVAKVLQQKIINFFCTVKQLNNKVPEQQQKNKENNKSQKVIQQSFIKNNLINIINNNNSLKSTLNVTNKQESNLQLKDPRMYKYLNLPTNKLPTHLIEVRNEFKDKNNDIIIQTTISNYFSPLEQFEWNHQIFYIPKILQKCEGKQFQVQDEKKQLAPLQSASIQLKQIGFKKYSEKQQEKIRKNNQGMQIYKKIIFNVCFNKFFQDISKNHQKRRYNQEQSKDLNPFTEYLSNIKKPIAIIKEQNGQIKIYQSQLDRENWRNKTDIFKTIKSQTQKRHHKRNDESIQNLSGLLKSINQKSPFKSNMIKKNIDLSDKKSQNQINDEFNLINYDYLQSNKEMKFDSDQQILTDEYFQQGIKSSDSESFQQKIQYHSKDIFYGNIETPSKNSYSFRKKQVKQQQYKQKNQNYNTETKKQLKKNLKEKYKIAQQEIDPKNSKKIKMEIVPQQDEIKFQIDSQIKKISAFETIPEFPENMIENNFKQKIVSETIIENNLQQKLVTENIIENNFLQKLVSENIKDNIQKQKLLVENEKIQTSNLIQEVRKDQIKEQDSIQEEEQLKNIFVVKNFAPTQQLDNPIFKTFFNQQQNSHNMFFNPIQNSIQNIPQNNIFQQQNNLFCLNDKPSPIIPIININTPQLFSNPFIGQQNIQYQQTYQIMNNENSNNMRDEGNGMSFNFNINPSQMNYLPQNTSLFSQQDSFQPTQLFSTTYTKQQFQQNQNPNQLISSDLFLSNTSQQQNKRNSSKLDASTNFVRSLTSKNQQQKTRIN